MSEKNGKSGGASGFLPGLVLGVIVGAATAFVALEVLDSPKLDIGSNPAAVTGERIERDSDRNAPTIPDTAVESAGEALNDAGEEIKDAAEDAAEEAKKLIDPPADTDGG